MFRNVRRKFMQTGTNTLVATKTEVLQRTAAVTTRF